MSLFNELKRRNVFRVGIAYAVATWLLLQVADIIVPLLELPEWVPKLILLLLLLGFVPALIFAWAFEMTPEGLKKEKDVDRTQSITPQTGRKLDFAIIGILALAVVILLFDKFNTGESAVNETAEQAAGAEAETPDQSIAVLPFVNMSEDAANEYFSDGISEEILNVLAGVKGLKVAGRTSSFAFKGRNEDLRMIGETLGVSHILEGSVRKAGDQLRITAQLVKVDDGFHLWSENFDRRLVDVFAIQDEIAQAILEQLKTHLIVGEPVKTAAPKSTDLKAFDLYLLAKQNIRLRNREALELADRLLGQAIEIDPQYAPAYAQQGIVRLLLVIDQYGNLPKEQSQSESRALLEKALSLDPELAEAHAGMGLYYSNETDQLDQSIASLNRALSINPGLLDASNWLQISYAYSGKIRASVEVLEDLFQRDPLYQPGFANLVNMYNEWRQFDKAQALIEQVRPFLGDRPIWKRQQGLILSGQGRTADALPYFEAATAEEPEAYLGRVFLSFALLSTMQYEAVLERGSDLHKPFVLWHLGRKEEARMTANSVAQKYDDPAVVMAFFDLENDFESVIGVYNSRWQNLDEYQEDNPGISYGYDEMVVVARAYKMTGDEEKFTDAARRLEVALKNQREQGSTHLSLLGSEAKLAMLLGDEEGALNKIELLVSHGIALPLFKQVNPIFEPLHADERFQAAVAQLRQYAHREREKLGLPSLREGMDL